MENYPVIPKKWELENLRNLFVASWMVQIKKQIGDYKWPILVEKVTQMTNSLGNIEFTCSHSWITRVRKLYAITTGTLSRSCYHWIFMKLNSVRVNIDKYKSRIWKLQYIQHWWNGFLLKCCRKKLVKFKGKSFNCVKCLKKAF